MFCDIAQNVWPHSPECLETFLLMFRDNPRNVVRHSPECLKTFPEFFEDIYGNIWGHSLKCLATFPWIFSNILRKTGDTPCKIGHFPECLRTFPVMFEDIPWNAWWCSSEYNIWYDINIWYMIYNIIYDIPPFPTFSPFRSLFLNFWFIHSRFVIAI